MSKIAGTFYFDGRPVSMAGHACIANALPTDAAATRTCSHAGLAMGCGHSRFELPAPYGLAVSADKGACAFDGRIDNRAELLRQFPLPAQVSDCEIALAVFQQGGVEGLHALVGDWSAAFYDARNRSVTLASDFAGIRPLYYFVDSSRILWSSSLGDLTRWTGIEDLDPDFVAGFLSRSQVIGRSPFRGIRPVTPGTALTASGQGTTTRRYWDIPVHQDIELPRDSDYDEELQRLFREAVQVRIAGKRHVCAELSGGLDSSSIAAMAARLHRESGDPSAFTTLSFTHEGCADEPFFRAVEETCGITGTHLPLQHYPFVAPHLTGGSFPAWWEPRNRQLLRHMESLGAGVLMTGQMGDLIMGNTPDDSDQVAASLRPGHLRNAAQEAFEWSQALRIPIYPILWRAARLRFSSWTPTANTDFGLSRTVLQTPEDSLTPEVRRTAFASRARIEEPRWRQVAPERRRRARALSEALEGRQLQTPEAFQEISYTHPYLHRPLVEFMLRIPPSVVCRPREPRRLMRRAFVGLIPEMVRNRRSKADYSGVFGQALKPMAAELLRRPREIRIVDRGLIEAGSFLGRLQQYTQNAPCNESQLRQLILFEFWLRNREAVTTTGKPEPLPLAG